MQQWAAHLMCGVLLVGVRWPGSSPSAPDTDDDGVDLPAETFSNTEHPGHRLIGFVGGLVIIALYVPMLWYLLCG